MANNKSDIGFAFDPAPFLTGLKKISTGIDSLETVLTKKSDSMEKSITMALTKASKQNSDTLKKVVKTNKDAGEAGSKSLEKVSKSAKEAGKGLAWAMAKGQLLANALTGIGKGLVNVINQQIPEMGQSFTMAKDIIFKNLFWPIRQTLVPMLQKMLNWVRDNRAMFTKMGQTIANVFSVAVKVGGILWDTLTSIGKALAPILGAAKGGLGEAINLIVGKIAVVAQYISVLLKPIIGGLANFVSDFAKSGILGDLFKFASSIVGTAWNVATSFFSGLEKWIKPAVTALDGMVSAIGKIWDNVFGKGGNNLNGFFQLLGTATGFTITSVLTTLANVLESINGTIEDAKILWNQLFKGGKSADELGKDAVAEALKKASKAKDAAGVQKIIEESYKGLAPSVQYGFRQALGALGPDFVKAFNAKGGPKINLNTERNSEWWGKGDVKTNVFTDAPKTNDGVIQNGKPVATDPKDVIVAHKGQVTVSKGSSAMGQGTWTVYLNVTEGSATQAGKNFADGLQYQMRSLLAHEAMIGGR